MISAIVDLQSDRMEVDEESNALKAHVDRMLSVYHDKKEMYTAAVESLEGSRKTIIREAEENAGVLIARAEKVSAEMVATAEKKSTDLIEQANKEIEKQNKTAEHEREEWEAEKASVADIQIQTFQPTVKICVGGEKFTTSLTTLTRFPDTMMGAMFSGRHDYGLKSLMFPFVPIAAFAIKCANGCTVTVKQDGNGIFSGNGQPLRLCTHSGAAAYGPVFSGYYIVDFRDLVASKGGTIVEGQPEWNLVL